MAGLGGAEAPYSLSTLYSWFALVEGVAEADRLAYLAPGYTGRVSLHQLGVVRDPSEGALESFGRRQLGVDRLQWADEGQAYRLIEALKAMAERAGWDQNTAGLEPAEAVAVLKDRLERLIAAKDAG